MNRSASSFMQRIGVAITISVFVVASIVRGSPSPSDATQKGRTFLAGLLDSELGLLPEYRGARVYWLFHDNYLAARVLKVSHPEIAQTIRSAIERDGLRRSGKIELLFGEVEKPLPFRQYQLIEVRRTSNKVIRTEVVTAAELDGWAQYADLLLLAFDSGPRDALTLLPVGSAILGQCPEQLTRIPRYLNSSPYELKSQPALVQMRLLCSRGSVHYQQRLEPPRFPFPSRRGGRYRPCVFSV